VKLWLPLVLCVCASAPTEDEVARLIKQLGHDDFARREAANKRLAEIGEPALDALKSAAASDDPEVRRRAALLVADIEHKLYGERLRLAGHRGQVYGVSVSADGKRLLTNSTDHTLRLWDADTGKLLRTFEGHTEKVYAAALSADGKRVLSGSDDATLRLWDADTGKQLREFKTGHMVKCVAFGPDGQPLAGSFNEVQLWDPGTGKKLRTLTGHRTWVIDLAYERGARLAATGGIDGSLRLWDVAGGEEVCTLEAGGGEPAVVGVRFSPDGKRLASVTGAGVLRLWDVQTGEVLVQVRAHEPSAECVAFSLDGRRVATGGDDNLVRVWDAATGKLLRKYEGHTATVTGVTFYPDGTRIVSASADRTARVWGAPH
jgi:WD40 repeat protein